MAGPRAQFRYFVVARNAINTIQCAVEADADAQSLVLGGVTNLQAPVGASNNFYEMEIPVLPGRRGNKARARVVQIRYTAGTDLVDLGSVAWIPVFRLDRFNSYAVGQTGSHRGVACTLIRKVDGSPTVTGKRNP
jgi:hypothetical protein